MFSPTRPARDVRHRLQAPASVHRPLAPPRLCRGLLLGPGVHLRRLRPAVEPRPPREEQGRPGPGGGRAGDVGGASGSRSHGGYYELFPLFCRHRIGISLLSQSTTTARTSPPPRPPSSPTRYDKKKRFFLYSQTLDIRCSHLIFLLAGPQGPVWRHRDAQPACRGLHQEGAKHTKATCFFSIYVLAKFTHAFSCFHVSIDWSWSPQWKRTTVLLCWEGTHCRGEKKHSEKKRYMIVAFSPFFNFFFPQVSSPSPSRLPHPARLPPGQPPPPPRPTRGDSELGKVSFLFCV